MLKEPTHAEIQAVLAETVRNFDQTLATYRANLVRIGQEMRMLFDPNRSGYNDDRMYFLMRQTIYQLSGYSHIETKMKTQLWAKLEELNPNMRVKARQEIYAATGLRVTEAAVETALRAKIHDIISHEEFRNAVVRYLNEKIRLDLLGY